MLHTTTLSVCPAAVPTSPPAFYVEVFGWKRNDALSIGDFGVVEIGEGPLTIGIGPVELLLPA